MAVVMQFDVDSAETPFETVTRSCPLKMFNLYQSINRKEDKEDKESDVIGHDRFYQEHRSRSKKKKRAPRRANSAAEFSNSTLEIARRRAAFAKRSHSSESKESDGDRAPKRSESFAKALFSKRSASTSRHEYSALRCDSSERNRPERHTRDGTFNLYKKYLSGNDRYQLREHLSNLGSRADKHWFIVQDNSLGAKRLMTVVSLPSSCPLIPSTTTRDTLLSLFGGLQHPYIHPVLDMEFWDSGAALISPLNPTGSLRDLIYGTSWHESCDKKYGGRGEGLHLRQIQCLGRQILEALLFLHNRNFPPFYHLHSGNVIIQNGAARLAGLENTLFGLSPRCPGAPANLAFGYLLFEMTAGYELPSPPTPGHLELELERMPKVAEVLEVIFLGSRSPSLEELLCFDLFRGVELRELRGASGVQTRTSPDVMKLMDLVRCPVTIPPVRRRDIVVIVGSRLEDILEEDSMEEDSDSNAPR